MDDRKPRMKEGRERKGKAQDPKTETGLSKESLCDGGVRAGLGA